MLKSLPRGGDSARYDEDHRSSFHTPVKASTHRTVTNEKGSTPTSYAAMRNQYASVSKDILAVDDMLSPEGTMQTRVKMQEAMGSCSAYINIDNSDDDHTTRSSSTHIDAYRKERRFEKNKKSISKKNARMFNNRLDKEFHQRTFSSPSATDSTMTEDDSRKNHKERRKNGGGMLQSDMSMNDNVIPNEAELRVNCMSRILHRDTTPNEKKCINKLLMLFANKFPTSEEEIRRFTMIKKMGLDAKNQGYQAHQTVECMLNTFSDK